MDLDLRGELVIVVGAGLEGLQKIDSLLTQDCKILVLDIKKSAKLEKYIKQKKVKFKKTKLNDASFLDGYKPRLVMAATNDKTLNKKITQKAKEINSLAYASDDPEASDFAHPSVINIQDTVQVAISTRGKSPVMAKKIKLQAAKIFKKIISKEDIALINLQHLARTAAKEKIKTQKQRKLFLYSILNDTKIKQLIKDDKLKDAQRRTMNILGEWK